MTQNLAKQAHLPDLITPAETALIVIDMQNDFCAPGGYIDTVMKRDVSAAKAIVPALNNLISAARKHGVPVVWVGSDYRPEKIPYSMQRKLTLRNITQVCCEPGSWGAEWYEVKPLPDEAVVIKHTYNGFTGTNLQSVLQEKGIKNLILTGVQTQGCVESTLREAHALGYVAVVPNDAVGSHTPDLHAATLKNVQFLFGEVASSSEIVAAWG